MWSREDGTISSAILQGSMWLSGRGVSAWGGREQANKVKNVVMGSMWERGQRSSMYREDVHACTYVRRRGRPLSDL